MTITIETERLSIVPFESKHITDEYLGWLNDSQLMKYSEQRHKKHSMETCLTYLKSFEDTENYFFAIEMNGVSRVHIGTITVYQDKSNKLADIGIMIGSKLAQKKGFGKEAWNSVVDWVKNTLKPRKITAGAMSENHAMISIMQQCGMKLDGIRKKHYLLNGKEVDIVYMAVFLSNDIK